MQTVEHILFSISSGKQVFPLYRPAKWESPIERQLWEALRFIGINVETQITIGNYRVDMLISSRLNSEEIIVECDGADYHYSLIDEFRDDEIIKEANIQIAHIYGDKIYASPEKCALYIVERWFPELMNTLGYHQTLEIVYGNEPETHPGGQWGFFPIGKVRPITGDDYPSHSIHRFRYYLRYIVGMESTCSFFNENEEKQVNELKDDYKKHNLPERHFSPQELARLYIQLFYAEPEQGEELERLDNFLERLREINKTR